MNRFDFKRLFFYIPYVNNILLGILLFIPSFSNVQEYNTFTYFVFLVLIFSNGILVVNNKKRL